MGPCLLGLFSLVCLIFAEHTRHHRPRVQGTTWYPKTEPTFSDALATVRRLFWLERILKHLLITGLSQNYRPRCETSCWTASPWPLNGHKTANVELRNAKFPGNGQTCDARPGLRGTP